MRYIIACFLLTSTLIYSQDLPVPASFSVVEDSLISKAFSLKLAANKERYAAYYFTIQLYYGNYEGAQKALANLSQVAPDLVPKLSFETPNYKVQVGPFKKRFEATERLQKLKQFYRGAFLLEPKVRF